MFCYGYRKSVSFLLINFARSLHAHDIQGHCGKSDPAFYARTKHKVNAGLKNHFNKTRPNTVLKRALCRTHCLHWWPPNPEKVQNPATVQRLAPFSCMQRLRLPSTCSKDVWFPARPFPHCSTTISAERHFR